MVALGAVIATLLGFALFYGLKGKKKSIDSSMKSSENRTCKSDSGRSTDIIIVGAGVAGSALAYTLGKVIKGIKTYHLHCCLFLSMFCKLFYLGVFFSGWTPRSCDWKRLTPAWQNCWRAAATWWISKASRVGSRRQALSIWILFFHFHRHRSIL